MELEDHDEVGERIEAGDGVLAESGTVQGDHRFDLTPIVVDGFVAAAHDIAHWLQRRSCWPKVVSAVVSGEESGP